MSKRGVTIVELLIVMTLIGVIAGLAFPRVGDAITKQNVRSARALFIGTLAKARATAIQRGATTQMIVTNGRITIRSNNPVTNAAQQVGPVEDLGSRFGVTLQPTTVTLTFDARGIGMETTQTTISITKGSYGNQIVISPVGRVIQ